MEMPTDIPWNECPMFDGDLVKCNIIYGIRKAFASFSVIGCIFMIAVICLFKKYELFVQRLILFLTVAALFGSVSDFLEIQEEDSALCHFEAWWTSFWDWATLLWVTCITINLYLIIIWMMNTEHREFVYHIVTWGISLLMACLPLIGNHYGPAGAWCWIKEEYPLWRFFMWYGPLVLLVILMFFVYTYITYKLRRRIRSWQGTYEPEIERSRQLIREEIKPLRAYPFIYLVLSIFPLINRIQNAIDPEHPVFALYLLHAMSDPLVGLVNAVVYGMDPETRSRLTWTQIKLAVRSHRAQKAIIQEYSIHQDPPLAPRETVADGDVGDGDVMIEQVDVGEGDADVMIERVDVGEGQAWREQEGVGGVQGNGGEGGSEEMKDDWASTGVEFRGVADISDVKEVGEI